MKPGAAGEVRILLVEDDPGDVLLIQESFEAWSRARRFELCADGEAAWRRLEKAGLSEQAPVPDLLVLDLNLPRRTGREVFGLVRKNPFLRDLPVAILTTSTSDADLVSGLDSRLNLYLTKPMRLEGFVEVAKAVERFYEKSSQPAARGRRR